MEFDKLLALLDAFEKERVEYVLVGGAAVNLHGIIRATEDMDFFVRPDPENVERLKRALRTVWNDPEIDQISAGDLAGQYPTIRYGPPDEDFVVDILSRLGEAFSFADIAWNPVVIEGVTVRLATPSALYRMKKDTIRPIDRADAATLKDKFGLNEE
jgi:hypothetical protein